MTDVTVIVPTFRRPDLLRRCLAAGLRQTAWRAVPGEIVVVDNCPQRSARGLVASLPPGPAAVRYVAEPRPGISHARNAGLERASGALIAFIDDDNVPCDGWLAALLAAQADTQADAVFGRIIGLPADPCPQRAAEFARHYSRDFGPERRDAARIRAFLGTGNSLFRRATTLAGPAPFDPALGLVGGEDMALLSRLAAAGCRFTYDPHAVALELVSAERLDRRTLCRRKFRSGQIRVQNLSAGGATDWPALARWMAVGAVQMGLHVPLALTADLLRRPALADRHWAAAWGGLGKVLWMRDPYPPFYGQPAPTAPAPSRG